jgi:hypothetical protein
MTNVRITDLNSTNFEPFFDDKLSTEETDAVVGGWGWKSALGGIAGGLVGGLPGAIVGAYLGSRSENSDSSNDEIEVRTFPSPSECENLPPGEACL